MEILNNLFFWHNLSSENISASLPDSTDQRILSLMFFHSYSQRQFWLFLVISSKKSLRHWSNVQMQIQTNLLKKWPKWKQLVLPLTWVAKLEIKQLEKSRNSLRRKKDSKVIFYRARICFTCSVLVCSILTMYPWRLLRIWSTKILEEELEAIKEANPILAVKKLEYRQIQEL